MKTVNLTPWCNLFSSESKYNVNVINSRYSVIFYTGVIVALVLIPLLYFTYAYHLAIIVVVIVFILFGLYLSQPRTQVIISRFELESSGHCIFEDNTQFQLQKNSRFSFLGCWLSLKPIANNNFSINVQPLQSKKMITNKHLFLFRDSINQQDFSRLAKVISQLNYQD